MVDVLGLVISHKWADVDELECATLEDTEKITNELSNKPEIEECAVISTCNRIEIIVVPKNSLKEVREVLLDYTEPKTDINLEEISRFFADEKYLRHLLKLASGLESMIIGEDQILGQVKDSYNAAKETDSIDSVLDLAFEKAINVGKKVRNETGINDGCVSMGSAAVELAEEVVGELSTKNALLVGAGEMATIIAKCLRDKGVNNIVIANRTYERAEKLSKKVNGEPVNFDRYKEFLEDIDILMTATGAPHPIIKKDDLKKNNKNNIIIIDISNPRDVEKDIDDLKNVSLYDIDDLELVTKQNKEKRNKEALKAEKIIKKGLNNLLDQYKKKKAEDLIAEIHEKAHDIRIRERDKAINKLSIDTEDKQIIEDLTRSIVNKILSEPTKYLKKAASNGDKKILESTSKIFDLREKE